MISKTIGFRGLAYFQTNPYALSGTLGPLCRIDRPGSGKADRPGPSGRCAASQLRNRHALRAVAAPPGPLPGVLKQLKTPPCMYKCNVL